MEEEYIPNKKSGKQHNTLPFWGNEASMNLNPLILANIQGSSYFKVHLFKLKTYHEVVDEIYYQVKHMEPWERGSRKTSGQTGMCGGVRGVGAGGIVSTAFCLLYKLYTLRLTRKQVNGLLNHTDSPYIRALGFMYLRYTQPPVDLYDWYEDYLLDEEEIDVKAGGGQVITMGNLVYQYLTKLDWFSTLFPRIPVPIQKQIERKIEQYCRINQITVQQLNSHVATSSTSNTIEYEGDRGDWGDRRDRGDRGERGDRSNRGATGYSRDNYSNRDNYGLPPFSNYRTEHDVRDYSKQRSRSPNRSDDRNNDRSDDRNKDRSRDGSNDRSHDRHRHKKKHKRKHSRSQSESKNRDQREARREREYGRNDYDRNYTKEHEYYEKSYR